MKLAQASFVSVALGLALVASSAQANMAIYASVNGGPLTELSSATGNGTVNFSGALGGFQINDLFVVGQNSFGGSGELLDVSSIDVSSKGTGNLVLQFTEDAISSPASLYSSVFSGDIHNANVMRSLSATSGAGTVGLGSTNAANAKFSSTVSGGVTALSERITITATGPGATLSGNDSVTASVPEPALFSLLGFGIAALGLARRRR